MFQEFTEKQEDWRSRFRRSALWLRDFALGGFGFVMVLGVAVSGWSVSFIGLHNFGVAHMGLKSGTAWLVPATFDGAPAGLSIVIMRAGVKGRTAYLWRVLVIAFTGLSSWINYIHLADGAGRWVASFMPPAAVLLFEGLMSETRHAARDRFGWRRAGIHPLRWVFAPWRTLGIYKAHVLSLDLPEELRVASAELAPTRTAELAPAPGERPLELAPGSTAPTGANSSTDASGANSPTDVPGASSTASTSGANSGTILAPTGANNGTGASSPTGANNALTSTSGAPQQLAPGSTASSTAASGASSPTGAKSTSGASNGTGAKNDVGASSTASSATGAKSGTGAKSAPPAQRSGSTPLGAKSGTGARKGGRRSMDEWVTVAGPLFHSEFARLKRQPTGAEFATAIADAGLGRVSASTAKNIRAEILDRMDLPTLI